MQYGRYQIVAELGRGSMGVVYKAHDPQIDRPVALKVLREDRVTSEDFVRRFLKEAMAVGHLSHPGIVTVYDVGQDHDSIYIAMEFLQGTPLDELMAQRKFSLPEIVDIGIQTARALHYAHQHGIVHRDIKPPNIIYSPQGTIRVTDFGIARIEDPNGHQMTQAGEILGTPLYMSPEQVMGQPLDGRSDVYSLGVILYQLTTGRRPFQGTTLAAIFRAITQDNPEAPHLIDPTVPEPLSDLIMKLLDRDPAKRFSSGGELADALQECLQPRSANRATISTKRPKERGDSRLLMAGVAVLIVCLGLGTYYFFRQQPVPAIPPVEKQQKTSSLPPGTSLPAGKPAVPPEGTAPLGPQIDLEEKKTPVRQEKIPQKQTPPTAERKKTPTQAVSSLSPTVSEGKSASAKQTVLKMDSRPSGADLYIDGVRVGKTPVRLKVAAGKHEVNLKLDKHLGWQAQLDLSKGGEVPLSIQLLPERTEKP